MNEVACHRERRPWTEDEDRLLRDAIAREDPDASPPSKWHAIATHLPNRTNKDCRKRWWAQMATTVSKGGWSAEEDERLCTAVEEHGTKWALVATKVQTRNSGQCAKRWNDALNPAIDRSDWTEDEDMLLVEAVKAQGKAWTSIVRAHLPGRTGLAAKNRYNHLVRATSDRSGTRDRRKSAGVPYGSSAGRRTSSLPRSSSASSNSTPPRISPAPSPTSAHTLHPLPLPLPAYKDSARLYAPSTGGGGDARAPGPSHLRFPSVDAPDAPELYAHLLPAYPASPTESLQSFGGSGSYFGGDLPGFAALDAHAYGDGADGGSNGGNGNGNGNGAYGAQYGSARGMHAQYDAPGMLGHSQSQGHGHHAQYAQGGYLQSYGDTSFSPHALDDGARYHERLLAPSSSSSSTSNGNGNGNGALGLGDAFRARGGGGSFERYALPALPLPLPHGLPHGLSPPLLHHHW